MAQVIRRKRKQIKKCPKCGERLKLMKDPEGKEWYFCFNCYKKEKE